MSRIVWSEQARDDLRRIRDYISADSPLAAKRLVQRIIERTRVLQRFPLMGSQVAEDDMGTYREVLQGNYRVIYRVDGKIVRIATVIHAARLLKADDLP